MDGQYSLGQRVLVNPKNSIVGRPEISIIDHKASVTVCVHCTVPTLQRDRCS